MSAAGNDIRIVLAQADETMELVSISPAGEVLARSALDVYTVSSMCVSGSGATIVADKARNEIVLADTSGRVTRRFGATGTEPEDSAARRRCARTARKTSMSATGGTGGSRSSTATASRSRFSWNPAPHPGDP